MPTRLYLRSLLSRQSGRPIGSATTDLDHGHAGAARLVCLTMSAQKGAAGATAAATCIAHPAGGLDLLRIFMSPALAGQALQLGTQFTVAGVYDANNGGAAPDELGALRAYVYLWRPGVGKVQALFGDGSALAGVTDPAPVRTPPYGPQWQSFDLPSLTVEVDVHLRDRIVVEVWHAREAEVSTTAVFAFDGTDDTYADGDMIGAGGSASYLEYSDDLILAGEVSMNSANILVGARDLQVDGVNVGALDGGATVTYEPTHVEHTVDQRMGVQRVDKIAERMTITAHLKEATLENLRIAWGQPSAALVTDGAKVTLNVGGDGAVTQHTLVLTGKAPGTTRTRTITCHKAVAVETSAHSYTKDGATVYPVSFVLVEDATKAAGLKYMTIEDDDGAFSFA